MSNCPTPLKGRKLNSAKTLASQHVAGHSLSFIITIVIMTLGWGLFVGLVSESCSWIWLSSVSSWNQNQSLKLTIIRCLRSPCFMMTISPFPLGGAFSPWWSLWFGFAISSYFAWGMWWLGTFSYFSHWFGGILALFSWAGMFRFTWNNTTNNKAFTN